MFDSTAERTLCLESHISPSQELKVMHSYFFWMLKESSALLALHAVRALRNQVMYFLPWGLLRKLLVPRFDSRLDQQLAKLKSSEQSL
jgi:hypothetical protein